ncbi:acyltransferase domain-containing protein [Actinomadura keratinilytica]
MEQLPGGGAMLAVEATEDEVLPLLDAYAGGLCVAAVNGPRAVVLSGDADAVRDARDHWTRAGRRTKELRVSHAFHSARMDPMLDTFRAHAEAVGHHVPRIPFVSNLTGRLVGGPGDGQPLDAATGPGTPARPYGSTTACGPRWTSAPRPSWSSPPARPSRRPSTTAPPTAVAAATASSPSRPSGPDAPSPPPP